MFQTCSMVIAVSEDFTNVSLYVSQVPQLLKKHAFWPFWPSNSFYRNYACCKTVKIWGFQGPPRTWDPLWGFLYHSPKKTTVSVSGSTKSLLPWVTTRRSRLMPALEAGLVGVNYTKVWCFLDAECVKQESTLHPPTFKYMIKLIGFI